ELEPEAGGEPGIVAQILLGGGPFPELFAEQKLAVDQLEGRLLVVGQGGEVAEVGVGGDALASPPALALIDAQGRDEAGRIEAAGPVEGGADVGASAVTPEAVCGPDGGGWVGGGR